MKINQCTFKLLHAISMSRCKMNLLRSHRASHVFAQILAWKSDFCSNKYRTHILRFQIVNKFSHQIFDCIHFRYDVFSGRCNLPPVFTEDMNNLALSEATPVGYIVYKLEGYDPEGGEVTFGLIGSDNFAVDPKSGEVKVIKALDREVCFTAHALSFKFNIIQSYWPKRQISPLNQCIHSVERNAMHNISFNLTSRTFELNIWINRITITTFNWMNFNGICIIF